MVLAALLANGAGVLMAGVEIIAHRGASYDAPENTLPAFELAPIHDQTGIGAKVN